MEKCLPKEGVLAETVLNSPEEVSLTEVAPIEAEKSTVTERKPPSSRQIGDPFQKRLLPSRPINSVSQTQLPSRQVGDPFQKRLLPSRPINPVSEKQLSSEALSFTEAAPIETSKNKSSEPAAIGKHLIWVMAAACGLSVANLIYAQSLLVTMAHSFATSADQIGFVLTLGLLGYAVGAVLIAPLGDKYNQRSLIVIMLCAVAIALATMAAAPTVTLLVIASFCVGLTSILTELIIPFAARLVPSNERGRIVGTMASGVLIGTLLANILSGFVGKYLGWRTMYWIAAALTIVLAIVMRTLLPNDRSTKSEVSYPQLLGSLWNILRSEPVLQDISFIGILVYGAFNVFWVTLSFFLETPPYHYESDVVGLFGLTGIVGALAASYVGKFADHKDARRVNMVALPITLLSFTVMWLTGQWLIGLIIGAMLLELGVQSCLVANETRTYSLNPEAWNRLNTIRIFMFTIGGSLGSILGAFGWSIAKWNGVCSAGCLLLIVAFGFYALHGKRIQQWRESLDR